MLLGYLKRSDRISIVVYHECIIHKFIMISQEADCRGGANMAQRRKSYVKVL